MLLSYHWGREALWALTSQPLSRAVPERRGPVESSGLWTPGQCVHAFVEHHYQGPGSVQGTWPAFWHWPSYLSWYALVSPLKKSFDKGENWGLGKLRSFIQGYTAAEGKAGILTWACLTVAPYITTMANHFLHRTVSWLLPFRNPWFS